MKPQTGQILRRIGLLIETLCLLGLLSLSRENAAPRAFLGITLLQLLTFGLVAGFILWFVGTVTIYWRRKPRDPA